MGIRSTQAIVLGILLSPLAVQARPVSFQDGWMAMTTNDSMENSAMFSYSPTAWDAFGIRTDFMRNDETWLHTLTYNRLLKRWNNAGSQANIFLMTGAGIGDNHGDMSPAAFGGMEADWESRRYYLSYENRFITSSANDQYFDQKTRIGVAPYIGDYESIHTWFMLQVQNNPSADDKFIVTPLVRMFNTEFLTEVGYSSNKTLLFNATWQF
jgi:hypothetical protein